MLVNTQVLGQLVDSGGQDSNLDLGRTGAPGWVAYCSMIAVFSSLRIIVCFHLSKIISHCLSCRYGRIARVKTRLSPGTERRGSGALRQLIKNTTRHPKSKA